MTLNCSSGAAQRGVATQEQLDWYHMITYPCQLIIRQFWFLGILRWSCEIICSMAKGHIPSLSLLWVCCLDLQGAWWGLYVYVHFFSIFCHWFWIFLLFKSKFSSWLLDRPSLHWLCNRQYNSFNTILWINLKSALKSYLYQILSDITVNIPVR